MTTPNPQPPTPDPDILAIRRRRLQEGRCVACGARSGWSALCTVCRQDQRWCPRCERVCALSEASRRDADRTSVPCRDCHRADQRVRQGTHARTGVPSWAAHIPTIVRLYRRNVPTAQIAAQFRVNPTTLRWYIAQARRRGLWPDGLTRGRCRRGSEHPCRTPGCTRPARSAGGECNPCRCRRYRKERRAKQTNARTQ